MSKIDELIAQYCPEGVRFKNLNEIVVISTGQKPIKIDGVSESKYDYINAGLEPSGSVSFSNTKGETITIPSRGQGGAGHVGYQMDDFWCGPLCYRINSKILDVKTKFIFYYLRDNQKQIIELRKTGSIPAVNKADILRFEIPIPPLPVQEEIVNILDKFTALEAELEAELEARTLQYEYYRNELLSFEGKEVEWKTLGEVGIFQRGKRFVRTDMIENGFPCIHYGEMYTHYNVFATESKSFVSPELAKKLRVANYGDVVIVAAGETIEDIGKATAWLGESDVVTHDACFTFKSPLNPKFVAYFSRTRLFHDQIKKHISSGKISAINAKGLEKAKIPIPPIEEQERIVAILDKFDALVNDISAGLPAEIQARRQQYEYYRGELLTFEPLHKRIKEKQH